MNNSTAIQSQVIKTLSLGDYLSIIGIVLVVLGFLILIPNTFMWVQSLGHKIENRFPKATNNLQFWLLFKGTIPAIIMVVAGSILQILGIILNRYQ